MPFHLSNGSHKSRNGSVSSTSSELRTMNPGDKFLNPRRAPVPKLPRLQTSPPLHQMLESAAGSPFGSAPSSAHSLLSSFGSSQPSSANGLRKFRLPRKPSSDGKSRSLSPPKGLRSPTKRLNLRAAFKGRVDLKANTRPARRSPSSERWDLKPPPSLAHTNNCRDLKSSNHARSQNGSRNGSRAQSPQNSDGRPSAELMMSKPLPLRRQPSGISVDGEDKVPLTSFQSHRRARSRSREPSPLRNSLLFAKNGSDQQNDFLSTVPQARSLEPLVEASSNQATPAGPVTARKVPETEALQADQQDLTEKRLPTLPNSPSSAYDPSFIENSPTKSLSEDLQQLESHFSSWTTTTTSSGTSPPNADRSHFSNCTYISTSYSPSSNYNSVLKAQRLASIADDIPSSPEQSQLSDHSSASVSPMLSSKHTSVASDDGCGLPSESTCSSISTYNSSSGSSPTTESSGLGLEFHGDKRHAGHFQGYKLPDDSEATIKAYPTFPSDAQPITRLALQRHGSEKDVLGTPSELQHTSSMQKLINELSYLGDMIQR